MFISTKGQVWGYDLFIAITIFIVGLLGVYVYATNFSQETNSVDNMLYHGNLVSSTILSEGSPDYWNTLIYETPGIISAGRINQTKLDYFSDLDYNTVKKKLGLKYDYYFYFQDIKVHNVLVEGIGKKPVSQQNLVKIERFVLYENKPVKFELLIWN